MPMHHAFCERGQTIDVKHATIIVFVFSCASDMCVAMDDSHRCVFGPELYQCACGTRCPPLHRDLCVEWPHVYQ